MTLLYYAELAAVPLVTFIIIGTAVGWLHGRWPMVGLPIALVMMLSALASGTPSTGAAHTRALFPVT